MPASGRARRSLGCTIAAGVLAVAATCHALAWPMPFGPATGNRVGTGVGTFPRWQALALATAAPIKWLVALAPGRLAAVDGEGSLTIVDVGAAGLSVVSRYGGVASPDGPPVAVRIDRDQHGVVLVSPDGRLLVWGDGALRAYDVGGPLSSLTFPAPVALDDRPGNDLLAVAQDGAVVLISGLAAGGPRAVARLDARALRDGRITIADLDGDGLAEAVVLAEATGRFSHGVFGERVEAASVLVLRVRPHGLELRARLSLPGAAVFEGRVPLLAAIGGGVQPAVLLARSGAARGTAPIALSLREAGLELLAEAPAVRSSDGWVHIVGAADLTGDAFPEIVAVAAPDRDGVLTAYHRRGGALVPVASAAGFAPHAPGSRNLEQELIADLDGDGRPEVVLPRRSRDVLVGLELRGERFVERWAVDFKSPLASNLVAADVDGDGLLDLAVAVRRGLHVFLSAR